MKFTYSILIVVLLVLSVPTSFAASSDSLEVSGWIPYWRDTEGIKDAKKNLKSIDVVYPFAFTVKLDGTLYDNAGLDERDWRAFLRTARKEKIEIIPSIMWSSGATIHGILSNTTARKKHIEAIAQMVEEGDFDGVDIDYEAKLPQTIDYFSLFLKELKDELGKSKVLACTVEARTPPESLYKVVPAVIQYANDYKEIGKYCDRIEIMAYDQQRADIELNSEKNGVPYMPIADVDWVRKVVALALEDFPKEKVILGIPTYGNHYAITVAPDWFRDYQRIGALNVPDILDIAKQYRVKPSRNKAGEMNFTYIPKSSKLKLSSKLSIPTKTLSGDVIALRALAYANKTGEAATFNYVSYSDAEAMKEKIDLAKEYNLRGVALFKFDGEEDKKVWNYLR